ncbi:hypothetical protein LTR62_005204 [Meristemomyces frigidus]|uniref:Scramblase-domain-containing protein n=1 Tax=Meristemomyces frigidus TaxID=1508187 RepID=A0AAN7TD99_9PEZI|nr:hypothetical protein LTR62_005204 [Meristemomyces frigidus]
MSASRWSLRLPRPSDLALRGALRDVEQRRWLQRPTIRSRAWVKRAGRQDDRNGAFLQWTQNRNEHQHQNPPARQQQGEPQQPGRNAQLATALAESDTSDLVSEVHIPHDPHSVLPSNHPALSLLANSSLVIQRQLEMMNVMLGFEQANKYIIMDGQGQTIGYIAEQDHGIGSTMARQFFKTHRSFTTHIFDKQEQEVLRIHRPFAYINSRIRIYDPVPEGGYGNIETSTALHGTSASSVIQPGAVAQVSPLKLDEMRIIGEAQQQWAPLRRKYNLFSYRPLDPPTEDNDIPRIESGDEPTSNTTALTEAKAPDQAIEAGMSQFAHVNEPFLSWDFNLRDESGGTVGSVNRNFGGFAREIFTDTGVFSLRMESAAQASVLESTEGNEVQRFEREARSMTLDQRAVMLATAVSIDFDYFSRHSSQTGGMGFMPIFWPMGGGAAEGGVAGGAVGAAGEAGAMEGAAGAAGRGISGAAGGVGESGAVAAGTVAGYEAMQRGAYGGDSNPANEEVFNPDGQSPQAGGGWSEAPQQQQQEQSPWGNENDNDNGDPWGGGDDPPPSAGGEGGGGGFMDSISDFFGD